jgi:hypothetical protein
VLIRAIRGNKSFFVANLIYMGEQIIYLLILAIPVACISWTFTHENIFKEPREYCIRKSKRCRKWYQRKFFYLFTCEYCLSHYITVIFLLLSGFKLLFDDWRGYIISGFSIVWIANIYMSLFAMIRLDMKKDRVEIESIMEDIKESQNSNK